MGTSPRTRPVYFSGRPLTVTGKVGTETGCVKSNRPRPSVPSPESDMKLRLFPQEPAGLVLLAQMASVIVAGTGTLSEILGAPASEHERLAEELHEHESKSLDLHFALLTHMRTSFVNPLPREDMYTLSRHLTEAMEKLDAAGDLVASTSWIGSPNGQPTNWRSSAGRPSSLWMP